MGMRADESTARARKLPWRRNEPMNVAGREVFDWLPVFDFSTDDVFRVIRDAGQSPHWAYAAGMSRLTAMKYPSLIRVIEADLASGRWAVIHLVSTGGGCPGLC